MDTDFGEILRYPEHPGAVILRFPYAFTSKEINERLEELFKSVSEDDLIGMITIVEFLYQKHEEYILKKGIQKMVSNSKSFEFLKEEGELYTSDDLKVRFK